MSHRDDCPSPRDAEREGERAHDWGRSRSSNPHESIWGRDEGCEEAAQAWRDGYRRAELRADEEREEEAARHRAAARRAYEIDEEAMYFSRMEMEDEAQRQAYYAQQDEERSADESLLPSPQAEE